MVSSFCRVKLGVHEETGEQVAVKIMDKSDIKAQEMTMNVRREIAIMKALNHRNIVNLQQVLTSQSKLYIVMDLVTGGELFTKILKEGKLPENTARHYFQQLVDGIEYCHRRGVCHRDLKPENLLIDETTGELKITDFGLSAMKGASTTEELLHTQCGSPNYCAPEIIARHKQGYNGAKVDAWSCGIILFALLAGYLPFYDENTKVLYRMIQRDDVKFPKKFPPDAKNLVLHLLHKDPDSRYTLAEVKKHSWFLVNYDGGDSSRSEQSKDAPSSSSPSVARRKRRGHARKSSVDQAPRPRRSERPDLDSTPHTHTSVPMPPAVAGDASPRTAPSAYRPPAPPSVTTPPATPPTRVAHTPPIPTPPPPPPFAPPPPPSYGTRAKIPISSALHPPPPYPVPKYVAPDSATSSVRNGNQVAVAGGHNPGEGDKSQASSIPQAPRFPPPPASHTTYAPPPLLPQLGSDPISTATDEGYEGKERLESPLPSPVPHLSSVPMHVSMENATDNVKPYVGQNQQRSTTGALQSKDDEDKYCRAPPSKLVMRNWNAQTAPPPSYPPASLSSVDPTGIVDQSSKYGNISSQECTPRAGDIVIGIDEGNTKSNGIDSTPLRFVELLKTTTDNLGNSEQSEFANGSGSNVSTRDDKETQLGTMEIRFEDRPGTRSRLSHSPEKGPSSYNTGLVSNKEGPAWSRKVAIGNSPTSSVAFPSKSDDIENVGETEASQDFKEEDSGASMKERLTAAMARYHRIFRLGTMVGITSSPSFNSNKRKSNSKDDEEECEKSTSKRSSFFSRAKAITGAWGIILSQELEEDSDSDDERPQVTEAELVAFSRLLDFWDNRRKSASVSSENEVILDDEEVSPLSDEDVTNIQSLLQKLEPKPIEEELVDVGGTDGYATSGGSAKSRSVSGSLKKVDSSGNQADDEGDEGTGGSSKTVVRIDSGEDDLENRQVWFKESKIPSESSPISTSSSLPRPPGSPPFTSQPNGDGKNISRISPQPPPFPPPPHRVSASTPGGVSIEIAVRGTSETLLSSSRPAMSSGQTEVKNRMTSEKPLEPRHVRNKSCGYGESNGFGELKTKRWDDVDWGVSGETGVGAGSTVGALVDDYRLPVTQSTVRDPFRPKPGGIYRGVRSQGNDGESEIGASGLKVRIDPAVDLMKGNGDTLKDNSVMGDKRKSSATGSEKDVDGRRTLSRDSGRMNSGASDGSGGASSGRKRGHLRTASRDDHSTRGLFAFNMFSRRKSWAMTSFDARCSPEECLLEIGKILVAMGCTVMMKKGENKMKCDAPIKQDTLKISITCSHDATKTTIHMKKARRDKSQVDAKEFYEFFQTVRSRFADRKSGSSAQAS